MGNGKIYLPTGTQGAPAVSFTADPASGFLLNEPGEVAISAGGSIGFYLKSNGFIELPGTTGIAIQAGTTAERPSSPLQGVLRYNLSTNSFETYIGSTWENIAMRSENSVFLRLDGTRAMTGALNMNSQNITNTGTINGISVTAHADRHLPNGADPITSASAVGLSLATTNTTGTANAFARADHTHAITGVQPESTQLTALASFASSGVLVRTGANTFAARSVAVTAGQLTVSNGDGIAGNPTLGLATTGVTAASYTRVTVDTYGRVTGGVLSSRSILASQLDNPSTAGNWPVTNLCPAYLDPNHTTLTVRGFDDARSEGVGFTETVPTNATSLKLSLVGHARTAPGAAVAAVFQIYVKRYPLGVAPSAWSSAINLTNVSIASGITVFAQTDTTLTLATLGVSVGDLFQVEIVRVGANASDTLVGDYLVSTVKLEWL